MSETRSSSELRRAFLDYFKDRVHTEVDSAPLIPRDDPTLLFTSAGMVQFKPYYVLAKPPLSRAVSAQRCLRLSDIEEVGHTPYHETFFEMLGNFSFGDYSKREAIAWAWDFLTNVLDLPKGEFWISVHKDDHEAARIWRTDIGVPEEKIVALGDKDNFWGPAGDTGACGPCSEIHFDTGPSRGCGRPACAPGCDCMRFFEIWNLVFPQLFQGKDGNREPLASPGIDTGMGLERLCTVVQGTQSIFETDLFDPIVQATRAEVERATGSPPAGDGVSTELAVIADHVRGAAFAVAENILPSNEGQGYVVRRLIRRAVRRGRSLGIEREFLHGLSGVVVELMGEAHPHLKAKREHVALVIRSEEERFLDTLAQGTAVFEELVESLTRSGAAVIPGDRAFALYDTYGFPLDLTSEMARECGLDIDIAGFEAAMEAQRQRGREASTFRREREQRSWEEVSGNPKGAGFVGYDIALKDAGELESVSETCMSEPVSTVITRVRRGEPRHQVEFALEETPFYAEAGGQVADTGTVTGEKLEVAVLRVYREDDEIVHVGSLARGDLSAGLCVSASVDLTRRLRIEKNHTATHLLQAALKGALGDHVHQSGSWVGPERLRFDFTHFADLSEREIAQVEDRVNAWIRLDIPVLAKQTELRSALESGATALFGEKYGTEVRAVGVGDVSLELCGGTHVRRTGEIGLFVITSESGIAAGVRRIEAITAADAVMKARRDARLLRRIADLLKTTPDGVVERVADLDAERTSLAKKLTAERRRRACLTTAGFAEEAREIGGIKVVSARTEAETIPELRTQADRLREELGTGAGLLATEIDGEAVLVAVVTDDLVKAGRMRAGDLVREAAAVMGGRGGGKPHLAQAGGGDLARLDKALAAVYEIVPRLAHG